MFVGCCQTACMAREFKEVIVVQGSDVAVTPVATPEVTVVSPRVVAVMLGRVSAPVVSQIGVTRVRTKTTVSRSKTRQAVGVVACTSPDGCVSKYTVTARVPTVTVRQRTHVRGTGAAVAIADVCECADMAACSAIHTVARMKVFHVVSTKSVKGACRCGCCD